MSAVDFYKVINSKIKKLPRKAFSFNVFVVIVLIDRTFMISTKVDLLRVLDQMRRTTHQCWKNSATLRIQTLSSHRVSLMLKLLSHVVLVAHINRTLRKCRLKMAGWAQDSDCPPVGLHCSVSASFWQVSFTFWKNDYHYQTNSVLSSQIGGKTFFAYWSPLLSMGTKEATHSYQFTSGSRCKGENHSH